MVELVQPFLWNHEMIDDVWLTAWGVQINIEAALFFMQHKLGNALNGI